MKKTFVSWLAIIWVGASMAQPAVKPIATPAIKTAVAQAPLPSRDLMVELRQVDADAESEKVYRAGVSAATDQAGPWPAVRLLLANGTQGVLRMQQAVPMQWVQSAQSQSNSLSVPGASAASSGGGVTQALQWFDVGQSMTVTPRWSGGNRDVNLELEVRQTDMQTVTNADLPRQVSNWVSTRMTLPLNQWTTIAASGNGPKPEGSYSSEARSNTRQLLQVRVLIP